MTGLDAAQSAVVTQAGSFLVRACPGAGKTRTIVHRFQHRSSKEPRRGIGLLSFTNAAVDEIRARCQQFPGATLAPNYIGTFDSFINRFITTPLYARDHGAQPSYSETWADLPFGTFKINGRAFELDWFDFVDDGAANLVEHRIPSGKRWKIIPTVRDNEARVLAEAKGRYRALQRFHCLSSDASRSMAMRWCHDPGTRQTIARLLSARFAEIIVDEAQDCGLDELELLNLLRGAGVSLVLVADTDQSIYGFRRASPKQVNTFAATLDTELSLDGNYRSTPAICGLNRSLRHLRREDVPVGPHAHSDTKVHVLAYSELGAIAPGVREIADENGLHEQEIVVLAHWRAHARDGADAPADQATSESAVVHLAAAHKTLTQAIDPKDRHRALIAVERLLIRTLADADDWDKASVPALCQRNGVDPSWLRHEAIRLVTATDPASCSPKAYARLLRDRIREIAQGRPGANPDTSILRAPTEQVWKHALSTPPPTRLGWNTIHSAKGLEYPAAVVIIPKSLPKELDGSTVLDHWQQDRPSEARRVLYVGASRAQRLAVLACHTNHIPQLRKILMSTGVNHIEYTPGTPTLF